MLSSHHEFRIFFICIGSTCEFLSLGSCYSFLSSIVHFSHYKRYAGPIFSVTLSHWKSPNMTSFSVKEVAKNEKGGWTGSRSSCHIRSKMVRWEERKNHKKIEEDESQWKGLLPQLFFSAYSSVKRKKGRGWEISRFVRYPTSIEFHIVWYPTNLGYRSKLRVKP